MLQPLILVAFARTIPLTYAHPNNVICNDPRMRDGGKMMGGYVTTNELTTDIVFKASATQYKYGEPVHFTVIANGSRFVKADAPHGVYLAVQVEFTGNNGQAMGKFFNLSEDLDYTPNCASSIFSKTVGGAFTGATSFSWIPSNHPFELTSLRTTGNATFKLVWANGPGGSDQLSKKLGVPNTYLYMKTVTLVDPTFYHHVTAAGTEVRPKMQNAGNRCVLNASKLTLVDGVEHSFKKSPVFVQKVEGGVQSLAADRCIKCRSGTSCRSAKIECPVRPGLPVIERLWFTSASCTGSASRVSKVSDVACPGPTHWHPDNLNLTRFVPKLQRDFPEQFPDGTTAVKALSEYKRMLRLVQTNPTMAVVPSKLVDLAWHSHILDTATYERDSLRMFGRYLHHAPSFGGAEEQSELVQQQDAMFKRYADAFDEQPNAVWDRQHRTVGEFPPSDDEVWKAQRSPDCCSAKCVKPSCAGCVGCNTVECGFLGFGEEAAQRKESERPLSPARFAGYVPSHAAAPLDASPPAPEFLCSASPHPKTKLSWSIVGDYIHFKHELKLEAWYGIGLANTSTKDMGNGVDYIVSMHSRNFSGVKDMYKWDAGNGWPCWDVEYECSAANKSKGTKDVEDEQLTRESGYTTSMWNRKLATPDYKDYDITNTFTRVLFAHGVEDYFTYHDTNYGECVLNFFTGETQDCWWAGPTPAQNPTPAPSPTPSAEKYQCSVCQHVYDPVKDGQGKAFEDLPSTWKCPVCQAPKSAYNKILLENGQAAWVHSHSEDVVI